MSDTTSAIGPASVVVVSGGSRGLGLAIVEDILAQGAKVAAFARTVTPELVQVIPLFRKGEVWDGETIDGVQLMEGHQFPDGVDPYVVVGDPTSGLLPEISGTGVAPFSTRMGVVSIEWV